MALSQCSAALSGPGRDCPGDVQHDQQVGRPASDTLALGLLCESYGPGAPTAALPYVNSAQAANLAYAESLRKLRTMGILIGSYEPHRPRAGGGAGRFHWEEALDLLTPQGGSAGRYSCR